MVLFKAITKTKVSGNPLECFLHFCCCPNHKDLGNSILPETFHNFQKWEAAVPCLQKVVNRLLSNLGHLPQNLLTTLKYTQSSAYPYPGHGEQRQWFQCFIVIGNQNLFDHVEEICLYELSL